MWSQDVAGEIAAELQGYPDFIIGNYSDGNLVASLLACKMGVTQVLFFLLFSLTLPWKCESHAIFYLYWNLLDLNVLFIVHNCPCTGENKVSRFGYVLEEV
jgi:hypothetical protein